MNTAGKRIKINERTFAGHIIGWIRQAISEGRTIFQDSTNDSGIKVESGRTKFPDILLFSDKIAGVVFNGWELKFPDTPVDDYELLENALEKAKQLRSLSFVTWNGRDTAIWQVIAGQYTVEHLKLLKKYPPIVTVSSREDLADPLLYQSNEIFLKDRLHEILTDLESLMLSGELKPAINISDHFLSSITDTAGILIPLFEEAIKKKNGSDLVFRNQFSQWKILENQSIRILSSSSSKVENITEERILSKFVFYNLISKILFYFTLSYNLSGKLKKIEITDPAEFKQKLWDYFNEASKIDFAAVYKPDFTDDLEYNSLIAQVLVELLGVFNNFDFKVLPVEVIGNVLEKLIPQSEKRKFGQYFTNPVLADLVSFPAIDLNSDILFDPTCGTGTFLESFYRILSFHGAKNHAEKLSQLWGNDISHFPAILSVINLYKQNLKEIFNFPRVLRGDYFDLKPDTQIPFPDPVDYNFAKEVKLPVFDAIISNFPFIQQEDIPNDLLSVHFNHLFDKSQQAFLVRNTFKINERSDYFTYCIYNSLQFLKEGGRISAITSNAWLGKEYGNQFKKFILDNFQIKYVIRSNAEHWFHDSQVSSLSILLVYSKTEIPTRFITLNRKLTELFDSSNPEMRLKAISGFYAEIENHDLNSGNNWKVDGVDSNFFRKADGSVHFRLVERGELIKAINQNGNWISFFSASPTIQKVGGDMVSPVTKIFRVFRGERTGWNDMFVVNRQRLRSNNIENEYLIPYIKSPSDIRSLRTGLSVSHYLFSCLASPVELGRAGKGALSWIDRFKDQRNKNGTKTIQEACSSHKPYWYSLTPKEAHIVTAVNPYERLFFSVATEPVCIDQRLIGFSVVAKYDPLLIAALLNSITTLIQIEQRGIPRHQGALDLNANFFKKIRMLDPDKLTNQQQTEIVDKFITLSGRDVLPVREEFDKEDRLNFEKSILKAYNLPVDILDELIADLKLAVKERTTLKKK